MVDPLAAIASGIVFIILLLLKNEITGLFSMSLSAQQNAIVILFYLFISLLVYAMMSRDRDF